MFIIGYLSNLISDKIIKILKFIYYILHKKSNTFFTTGNDKLIDWSYFLAAGHKIFNTGQIIHDQCWS